MIVLVFNFLRNSSYKAITLWPFVVFFDVEVRKNTVILNHEKIHLRQQLELLIVPFYIWYFCSFVFNYIKFKSWDLAYRNVIFEREAYHNESNMKYLKTRKMYAFLNG